MGESSWAKRFSDALVKEGAKVWLAESEVKAGDSIREAIEKGLRQSELFVTLIDAKMLDSPSLFFELGAAIGMGKRVVAVVPKEIDSTRLPVSLRTRRYLIKDAPEATARELLAGEIREETG
jgi:hypothetical protein